MHLIRDRFKVQGEGASLNFLRWVVFIIITNVSRPDSECSLCVDSSSVKSFRDGQEIRIGDKLALNSHYLFINKHTFIGQGAKGHCLDLISQREPLTSWINHGNRI